MAGLSQLLIELVNIIFKFRISNIFIYSALTPIWSSVAIYYNVTDYDLNWFPNMYFISLFTTTFGFNPFILKYFGQSQIFSCILTTSALWLLLISGNDFSMGLLCFALLGLGESLYYQVPLRKQENKFIVDLSKIWFPHEERALSTFIGSYASNIGMLLSTIVSFYYFYEVVDENEFQTKYQNLIFATAIFASIVLVCNLITLKKPINQKDSIQIRDSLWVSIKKICTAEEAIFDLLSFSVFIGVGWSYSALFNIQQYNIGYTALELFETNLWYQIGGILIAALYTWKLHSQSQHGLQQSYDKYMKQIVSIGFWALAIEIIIFDYVPFWILQILNFLVGCGFGGYYSILLESLQEKHFPAQELAIGSVLSAASCVRLFNIIKTASILVIMILGLPEFQRYGFQISCYLLIMPFCFIIVFYKTQFKRFEQEA
ncbi:unnamed protein product (macronuclear) [Paramecium tetraurelia]|uniref:Major facilitator superfamily (MFS) profile domain-containing protein n=1 Tax=Paramecium tetraurelia TaxID=5888 RepID=A0CTE2_PARTE|nr:uncharacterized protein GSPATT00010293001 [Paramecium tetraurelia]CAK74059.1 unnamed protein product [Paramecium tetraurelia]|eukprot:XP_001441456.1 hypothetical protein (macronuclear) [Paramecium tetraurelia strain d4-2]